MPARCTGTEQLRDEDIKLREMKGFISRLALMACINYFSL